MPDSSPWTIEDYRQESLSSAKSGCVKVFQALGAFKDQIVVIGGLVPALLIDQSDFDQIHDPAVSHVGTRDVDVGLSLGIIECESYGKIVERLTRSGFERDKNEQGNPTNHRWVTGILNSKITVDFQIPPDQESPAPGKMQNLTGNLSAIVTPGLELAFEDTRKQIIEHETPGEDQIEREIQTCGPASLLVLKGLAIHEREKWKDYYDIFYLLRNWPEGIEDIAEQMIKLKRFDQRGHVNACIENLRLDFQSIDHVGPRNVVRFFFGEEFGTLQTENQEIDQLRRQAEVLVNELLAYI